VGDRSTLGDLLPLHRDASSSEAQLSCTRTYLHPRLTQPSTGDDNAFEHKRHFFAFPVASGWGENWWHPLVILTWGRVTQRIPPPHNGIHHPRSISHAPSQTDRFPPKIPLVSVWSSQFALELPGNCDHCHTQQHSLGDSHEVVGRWFLHGPRTRTGVLWSMCCPR
jgi:hypothetical protein